MNDLDKKAAILPAQLKLLCASGRYAIIIASILAAILTYVLSGVVTPVLVFSWLALVLLIAMVRLIMVKKYRDYPVSDYLVNLSRLRNFRAGVLATSLIWGSAGILLFPSDLQLQLFLIYILGGISTALMVSYTADIVTAIASSLLIALPLILKLLLGGNSSSIPTGVAALLYLGFMIINTFHNNKRILENLALQFEAEKRNESIIKSTQIHQSILDKSMNGFLLVDKQGMILQANDAYCQMSGYSRQELLSMSIPTLEVNESADEVARHVQKIIDQGGDRFESAHRRKDGSTFPVEISAQYMLIEDEQLVVFIQDITQRKLTERALHSSESQLRTIFETEPECIKVMGADGRLRQMNPAGLAMIEADSLEQAKQINLMDLIVPAYREAFSELHKRVIAGETAQLQFEVIGLKGGHRWLETHAVPMLENGETMLLSVTRDISIQKQIEADIVESRNLLKTIIDVAPVQIFWKDTNSRYLGGNTAFAKDAKLNSSEDLIGKLDTDLLWKDSAEKFQQEDREILESGIPKLNYEHMLVRPNGEITWARSSKTPLKDLNGEMIGVLGVDEDITERKQLEEARLETQQRFEKTARNVPGIVYQFRLRSDGSSCFPFASEALNDIFRVSPEEVREDASKVFATIHPDDHDDIVTSIEISAKDLTLWREEFRVRYEDGTERWLFGNSLPELQQNGDVLWHGFITDMTQQKHMEKELAESEARWKFAIEGSGDGVWDVNVQTQEANFSKRWKEMLGFDADEQMSNRQEWISRIHPDDRTNILDTGLAYLEGKIDAYVVEYRLQCKDGQYKWMLSRGMLVSRDEAGKPLRMIGTQTDITERKNAELTLRNARVELEESHEKFKDLYEFAPIGYITISNHGLITQLNWRASAMLGLDRKNIINQRITQFIDESDKARWIRTFSTLKDLSPSEELSFDLKFMLHNGVSFYANLNCIRTDDEDEQSMLRVTLEDITMVKKSEIDLRIAATAFESQDGLMITDAENRILRVNKAFTDITGYSDAEIIGKPPSMLSSGRHDATFYAAMWESLNATGRWSGEIWNRRKSGDVYPENLTISTVTNDFGVITNYVAANTDISHMKAATEEIQQLAFFDSLTQLPNRRLLMDRLKHALAACARSGRQGAVLFLDLDHFKVLNDSLGHDIGDLLLQQVAARLTTCVREGDTVARLGGDEYVVVLEDLSDQGFEAAAQTEIIANKILAALNQPYELDVHEHHITPSIGITVFEGHAATIEDLLKQADIAMYQAKKAGRNTMRFFNPQMQISITARVAIERELRKALENKQLHLYYQIQVDNLGHPLGAEALIRWIHPERGIVSPAQFIPLAEETGLILPIGNWVLDTACAQIKEWHKDPQTRDLTLSINVSAKQFRQADFVEQVRSAIERHAIDPMQLKLELTESLLVDNIEDTIVSMTALGEIGVQFSLDDFGTGYSSLQYLKRLPLFQLKIDQSFVRDIVTDSHDRSIVRTIVAMAQSLYLNVIAEGVETEEQRALLLSNGCKRYQGYLFSKPVPIEQFDVVLKQIATKVSSTTVLEHI
jgi:diguanylate cyclase (GGDEF)-like protein/PAS domain S-box-containing protein